MTPLKRHTVTIKRPTSTLGSHGQVVSSAQTVAVDVPCSIEPLSGRELEFARQIVSDATQRVRLYDDPSWSLTTKDYLEFGSRRLNIGYIKRVEEIQLEVELTCAEAA